MASKKDLENFILNAAQEMGHFKQANPALLNAPIMHDFIAAGHELYNYYSASDDTTVRDSVLGAYVDCAMLMSNMASHDALSADERNIAEEICVAAEDVVNAVTAAVENNIHNKR